VRFIRTTYTTSLSSRPIVLYCLSISQKTCNLSGFLNCNIVDAETLVGSMFVQASPDSHSQVSKTGSRNALVSASNAELHLVPVVSLTANLLPLVVSECWRVVASAVVDVHVRPLSVPGIDLDEVKRNLVDTGRHPVRLLQVCSPALGVVTTTDPAIFTTHCGSHAVPAVRAPGVEALGNIFER